VALFASGRPAHGSCFPVSSLPSFALSPSGHELPVAFTQGFASRLPCFLQYLSNLLSRFFRGLYHFSFHARHFKKMTSARCISAQACCREKRHQIEILSLRWLTVIGGEQSPGMSDDNAMVF